MGIFVGLLTALGASVYNVFVKELKDFDPNFLLWIRVTAAAPILALLVLFFSEWFIPAKEFWVITFFARIPLEIALAYLGIRALHISPLSIIGPLASFTSIFLIPVGFFLLGELPTPVGFVGVLFIISGSFLLGSRKSEPLWLGLRTLSKDRGVRLALFAALVASFAIGITKFSFQYAPPLLNAFYTNILLSLFLLPFLANEPQEKLSQRKKPLSGLWLTASASIALHNIGLSLMNAVYFTSIKRLSMLLDVFFGKKFFQEGYMKERSVGTTLMLLGIMCIAFG